MATGYKGWSIATIIRLNAGNDTNGNPRRVYVAFDVDCNIAGAWDEGYSGHNAVPVELRPMARQAVTLATTSKERKELLAMFDKAGNRKA
jgi:hypothetical protein